MKLIYGLLVLSFFLFFGSATLYFSVLFADVNLITKLICGFVGVGHIALWCYIYFGNLRPLMKQVDDLYKRK